MSIKQIIYIFWSICLSCVVCLYLLNSPIHAENSNSSAYAKNNTALNSFGGGFWTAIGGVLGGAVGSVGVCYAVDVVVAPIAPPAALYLASMCPAVGSFAGGSAGAIGVGKALSPAF